MFNIFFLLLIYQILSELLVEGKKSVKKEKGSTSAKTGGHTTSKSSSSKTKEEIKAEKKAEKIKAEKEAEKKAHANQKKKVIRILNVMFDHYEIICIFCFFKIYLTASELQDGGCFSW